MNQTHYPHWPANLPYSLTTPATSVYTNLEVNARRYPDVAALIFYDTVLSYREFNDAVCALAGYLQQECGVKRGDRVLLDAQNSPQFVIGFYAIMRADAVVVPVNPMLLTDELEHYVADSDATTVIATQDVFPRLAPLMGKGLKHAIVGTYSDYVTTPTTLAVPDFVRAPRAALEAPGAVSWAEVQAKKIPPGPHLAGPDDLCVMPYTSGTTGKPKGCMHTHASVMFNAVGSPTWAGIVLAGQVTLAVLPFFHVTGMQSVMNAAIYSGSAIAILPRWDRDVAGELITRYKVSNWTLVPAMMIDFLSNPKLGDYNVSGLKRISGGGAAMPAAIAQKLLDLTGQHYMEGYGLSETIAASHINPPQRMKQQCLGIPHFNVDSRVVDPVTLQECKQGDVGEIWIAGPQVFQGYWKDAQKTAESFAELDGVRFFRSGDLGYMDEEGFFFYTDRLKRMINASGFKVWPAEVENMMYAHPAVQECCIISAQDAKRGETVKAVIVKKPGAEVSEQDIVDWAHDKMAAYKAPRIVQFVENLPKSATGKVMWRALQEAEKANAGA